MIIHWEHKIRLEQQLCVSATLLTANQNKNNITYWDQFSLACECASAQDALSLSCLFDCLLSHEGAKNYYTSVPWLWCACTYTVSIALLCSALRKTNVQTSIVHLGFIMGHQYNVFFLFLLDSRSTYCICAANIWASCVCLFVDSIWIISTR